MISIKNLTLPYGIKEVTCTLPNNRLIGVLGANGAGKSSLLKALAGIITPTAGRIVIAGKDNQKLSYQARSELIAYLAQDTPVHWALSVYDVIALGTLKRLSPAIEKTKVYEVAERCEVSSLLNSNIETLSGGERARVHLARCLMKDAPILLADEPIAALDPYYQIDIMTHLKQIAEQTTCVVVLHHLALAYRFCDEIVLLKNGKLLSAGRTEAVITADNLAHAFQVTANIDCKQREISQIRIRCYCKRLQITT